MLKYSVQMTVYKVEINVIVIIHYVIMMGALYLYIHATIIIFDQIAYTYNALHFFNILEYNIIKILSLY